MVSNKITGNGNVINQVTFIFQEAPKQVEKNPKKKFDWKKLLRNIHRPLLWLWKIIIGFITLNSS